MAEFLSGLTNQGARARLERRQGARARLERRQAVSEAAGTDEDGEPDLDAGAPRSGARVLAEIDRMFVQVVALVGEAIAGATHALLACDRDAAKQLMARDELHVGLTAELATGAMPVPVAIELAMVARFYERFGDHAVNLARRVAALSAGAPDPGGPGAG